MQNTVIQIYKNLQVYTSKFFTEIGIFQFQKISQKDACTHIMQSLFEHLLLRTIDLGLR